MSFVGHAIPASFFFGLSSVYLGLTFKRCRELVRISAATSSCGEGGGCHGGLKSFCNLHVPERSTFVLGGLGIFLMVAATIGVFTEALGSIDAGLSFFHQLAHESLYLCFFLVGAVASLESRRRVPPDSTRVAMALAFFLQYLLWNEHGLMKEGLHKRTHILLAQINLAAAVVFSYSVYNPRSLLAYVIAGALMMLNSLWMFTIGLTYYGVDIMMHTIAAVLVLEALLIAAVIVVGVAQLGGMINDDTGAYNLVAFSKPSSSVDDDKQRSTENELHVGVESGDPCGIL